VCSGPASTDLDVASLVSTAGNRWSAAGDPTVYLAGDTGVAMAEVGRHWPQDAGRMCLWQVRLELAAALDLRDPRVRSSAGVPEDPRWFLDRSRCQGLAGRCREAGLDGVIVPSVAFLDDMGRWNVVVFADRFSSLDLALHSPRALHEIRPIH
jgi:RES domain-containing protein